MMKLSNLLENFKDGKDVLVRLESGDVFVLYDFEIVDESIYDRDDYVLSTMREVIRSEFNYRDGTKLEFTLGDIADLIDPITRVSYLKAD